MPRTDLLRPSRTALFLLAVAVAAILPSFERPGSADARGVWCSGDPTILVNGNAVSVTVHVPLDRMQDLDYVEVIFHVPSNADVQLLVNDSILVPAKTRFVKDQPPTRRWLLSATPIPVEILAHHSGGVMPIAATTISVGNGTSIWTEGTSDSPLWVQTSGFLGLRLF